MGGTVKIVTRPYRIVNPPKARAGVLPGEGLMGVVRDRSPETFNLNLLFIPFVVVVVLIMEEYKDEIPVGANEIQRCGIEFIERPSADIVIILVLNNCDPPATGGGGGG